MTKFFCSLALGAAALAAEPADWIVTARYVVTMDPQRRIIENGAVAVRGDAIVGVGSFAEIGQKFQARQRLDHGAALIAPGLVNTHTHAAMSLFRGVANDVRLQEWLEKYIFPAEARNLTPEFVRWGTRLACLEMLLSGTTLFTDSYYFEDTVAETVKEVGMRGVLGQTIIGFPVADHKTPADALRFADTYLARYSNDPLVVPAVSPHAIYTNTDETLRSARALANKHAKPMLIHLSETKRENDDTLAKRGASPTKILDGMGMFEGRTIAAHGAKLDDADLSILKRRGAGIAHCPSSNMKLASGVAPVVRMLSLGIPVGLGPDGPAGSNNDFNLFEEMDLAGKLAKVMTNDPTALPAATIVEMATIGGARVAGLDKQIGSLESGKKADMIVVRIDRPHAVPMYDVYSQMVYSLKGSDVSDVMVNGRWLVRNRVAQTLKQAEIIDKAEQYRLKISTSLNR